MGIYDETDIRITTDGDFVIKDGDFSTVESFEAAAQNVYCRIKSSDPEWYLETIAANLEDLLGKPNTEETGKAGEELIRDALTKDGLINYDDLYIQAVPLDKFTLVFYVFFKPEEYEGDPIGYEVELNLSQGAKIRRVK